MAAPPPQQTIFMPQSTPGYQTVNLGQQQIAVAGQQPSSTSTINNDPRHRNKKTLHGFGIAECVIGGLSVLLAVIANAIVEQIYRDAYRRAVYLARGGMGFTFISQGIWCGVFVIVTGILGIRVLNTPSRCMYIANMIMAIATACLTFCGTILSGVAAGLIAGSGPMVALHSILTILLFAAMVITITHSAFCCSGVCYNSNSVATQQVMYFPQQNMAQPQPQYVQGPNGQLMMVVNQPMMPQIVQQPSAFQQPVPATVNPAVTPMPSASVQQPGTTNENEPGKAPPAYNPGI